MNTKYSPTRFPLVFSEMISEAVVDLPAPQDATFLREAAGLAMDAFWHNYVFLQPVDAQQEYYDAAEKEDTKLLVSWFKKHANFAENAEAEERGSRILEELAAKLPAVLSEMYKSFAA